MQSLEKNEVVRQTNLKLVITQSYMTYYNLMSNPDHVTQTEIGAQGVHSGPPAVYFRPWRHFPHPQWRKLAETF